MDAWTRQQRLPRYIASFTRAEVKGNGTLRGAYGDGDSPEAAIANYALEICGETLVIGAFAFDRREIQCPNEWLSHA